MHLVRSKHFYSIGKLFLLDDNINNIAKLGQIEVLTLQSKPLSYARLTPKERNFGDI